MKRDEWRDHCELSEEEMHGLESYLKTNDCKILSIVRGKWDNIGFRDRKVVWLI